MTLPTREFRFSAQNGPAGHCFQAQVWAHDGANLAEIEPSADPAYASGIARLFAKSPRLVVLIEELILRAGEPELSVEYDLFDAARTEARELIAELRSPPG